ncbi:SRPBCC family protein [Sporocytophaga myxococcoides]|uniref:SRPBCC family protein n=1 Tax=Sporocytophaga myxococcoides TaxID=153721 RepID=UPI000407372C|nr:SRPBCC domain-containing protein [Sporocytophaga myxococcoides]
MENQSYTTAILVNKSLKKAFEAVNNVRGWWTENIEGNTQKLNDEFVVRFGEVHYSKQKLTEFIPDTKVVWLVTDSKLSFVQDQQEWTNTRIIFELSELNGQTLVRFTHLGLVPEYECHEACTGAWSGYIHNSLKELIETGEGKPEPEAV